MNYELLLAIVGGGFGTKIIEYLMFKKKRNDTTLNESIETLIEEYKTDNEKLRLREQTHQKEIDDLRIKVVEFFNQNLDLVKEIKELKSVINDLEKKVSHLTSEYEKYHK